MRKVYYQNAVAKGTINGVIGVIRKSGIDKIAPKINKNSIVKSLLY